MTNKPLVVSETVKAFGHNNVRSQHETTLEFTKENHLTPQGDCIIAIGADKGMSELSENFKMLMRNYNTMLDISIECDGVHDEVKAYGHPDLSFTHPTDMVVRKSMFICDRTLAVRANKSASDLKRELVEKLNVGGNPVTVRLTARLVHEKDGC